MPVRRVRIENLSLVVPGVSREEARCIGEEVARRLARQAGSMPLCSRGTLDVRVHVPSGVRREQMIEQIVAAIARGMG